MSRTLSIDNIYAQPISGLGKFEFNQSVAEVFPDMIKRSVPGYGTIVNMTGLLAEKYARPDTAIYDLGCSLGASTFAMADKVQSQQTPIIGIDCADAMISRCEAIDHKFQNVQFSRGDVLATNFDSSSVVVLNFTLQFIPVAEREALIQRIHDALVPGGILVISEKIRFEDEELDRLNIEMHENFKRLNGYSELEIAQKRAALEKVLQPETVNAHKSRLEAARFKQQDIWFQCFNFISMIAIK